MLITMKSNPHTMSVQAVPAILPLLPTPLDLRFHSPISAVSKKFDIDAKLRAIWCLNYNDAVQWAQSGRKNPSHVSDYLEFNKYQEIVSSQYI